MNSFVRYAIWLGCTVVVACGDGKSGERDGAPADRSRPASGQDGGTDRAVDVDAATDHVAPPRVDAHPPCVFSADCPAGQYCDLGECVQDCNTDSACAPGLSCSPRGRCAAPGAPEEDPPPVTRRQGAVTADPASVVLTDGDDGLSIRLAFRRATPARSLDGARSPCRTAWSSRSRTSDPQTSAGTAITSTVRSGARSP